jgi:hypothetical protein
MNRLVATHAHDRCGILRRDPAGQFQRFLDALSFGHFHLQSSRLLLKGSNLAEPCGVVLPRKVFSREHAAVRQADLLERTTINGFRKSLQRIRAEQIEGMLLPQLVPELLQLRRGCAISS